MTIMRMDEGLDTGPMLLKRELDIRGKNAGQVTDEMAKLGARALVDWLDHPTPPRAAGGRRDLCIEDRQGRGADRLDARPPSEIERQVRAFAPAPGAWFETNGERIKSAAKRRNGRIAIRAAVTARDGADDCACLIAVAEGAIRPLELQRAGRAPMSTGELLRGFSIPTGTILT